MSLWIDEMERDLGPKARLQLIAAVGGQRRSVPHVANVEGSALATELGIETVRWLASRFAGTPVDFPSSRGREKERLAALLRAAILEAGLTNPTRSANDLAAEFGVSWSWVSKLRSQMRAESDSERQLRLFD